MWKWGNSEWLTHKFFNIEMAPFVSIYFLHYFMIYPTSTPYLVIYLRVLTKLFFYCGGVKCNTI